MYDRIFTMKFLPPGRMLWALGSKIVHERKVGQALFNCAFVSTDHMDESVLEATKPFTFMMDMSMVGVGVGFDVEGAGKISVQKPIGFETEVLDIPDSREGWVKSLELHLEYYFSAPFGKANEKEIVFNYDPIRPSGAPIEGFGGVSSGPAPLIRMHDQIRDILKGLDAKELSVTYITDIMNMIVIV